MSVHVFTLFLSGGAAILALWLLTRFPDLGPKTPRGATGAVAVAILALLATPPAIGLVGRFAGVLGATFFVALPGAVLVFLAVGWIMLFVIRAIQPHMR